MRYKYCKYDLPIGKLNQLVVKTKYPDEVYFVRFLKFIQNPYWRGFAYDLHSTDIELAVNLDKQFDLKSGWQNTLSKHDIDHVDIIAKLVKLIPNNYIDCLDFDTYSCSVSKVEGHHRLLALLYLNDGEDFMFPVNLSGEVEFIEKWIEYVHLSYKEIALKCK